MIRAVAQGVPIRILRILLVLAVSISLYQSAPPPNFHKQIANAQAREEVSQQSQQPPQQKPEASKKERTPKPKKVKVQRNPLTNRQIGQQMAAQKGWTGDQWICLEQLWTHESNWNHAAYNPSGATGIPQSLPASKMASHGNDYLTNPRTQIAWGLDYIARTYSTPCNALGSWNSRSPNWY